MTLFINIATKAAWILGVLIIIVLANAQLILSAVTPIPLYYTNIPYPMDKESYTQKDTISYSVSRCSNESTALSVTSNKELYNPLTGVIIPLPSGSGIVSPGCATSRMTFSGIIPEGTPNGTYIIRGVTTMRGRYRTIDVAWQTQAFQYMGDKE